MSGKREVQDEGRIRPKPTPKKYGSQTAEKLAEKQEAEEEYAKYEAIMNDETQKDQWKGLDFRYHEKYVIFKEKVLINIETRHIVTQVIKQGYYMVNIWNDAYQKWQWEFVHKLMGYAFLPVPNNDYDTYDTIDHIDSQDKLNNGLSNLRWATRQMQNANRRDFSRKWKAVIQLDEDKNIIEIHESVIIAVLKLFPNLTPNDKTEVNRKMINIRSSISVRGRSAGYYWEYVKYVDKEGEIWREDFIFEDCIVTISNRGNRRTKNGVVNKGQLTPGGYYMMAIRNITTGEYQQKPASRIIYSAFSGEDIPIGMVVDHIIEGETTNNNFENLQVLSRGENVKKALRERAKAAKGTARDMGVFRLNLDGTFADHDELGNETKYEFDSPIDASEKTGSSNSFISALCNLVDRHFTVDNFLWIYRKDYNPENVAYLVQRYENYTRKYMVYSISFDGKKRTLHTSSTKGLEYVGGNINNRNGVSSASRGIKTSFLNHVWIKYFDYTPEIEKERLDRLTSTQKQFKCTCCHK